MKHRKFNSAWEAFVFYVVATLICVVVLGIPVGFWIGQSAMEARAYERVTGKKVSTWDAMWVELRVQGAPE